MRFDVLYAPVNETEEDLYYQEKRVQSKNEEGNQGSTHTHLIPSCTYNEMEEVSSCFSDNSLFPPHVSLLSRDGDSGGGEEEKKEEVDGSEDLHPMYSSKEARDLVDSYQTKGHALFNYIEVHKNKQNSKTTASLML